MAMINPDFSEAFKPIPEGRFSARVSNYALKTARESGAQYISWTIELLDEDVSGRKIQFNTMISGKGAGILLHFLKTIDGVYEGGQFDPDEYVGGRLGVEVKHEEYNGKANPKIKDVFTQEAPF